MKKILCIAFAMLIMLTLSACHKPPKIVDESWEYIDIFHCGLVSFRENGLFGFLNDKGEVVVEPKFDRVNEFTSIGIAAVRYEGKWGYIDTNGDYIVDPTYSFAEDFSEYGLAAVRMGAKTGYVNTKGKLVIDCIYSDAQPFSSNGYAYVWGENNEWYHIDGKGKRVDDEDVIITTSEFSDGLCVAYSPTKDAYGYVNEDYEFVIEPQFIEHCSVFENGTAVVIKDSPDEWYYGLINTEGEFLLDMIYEGIYYFNGGDLLRVRLNEKYAFADSEGNFLTDFVFDHIGDLSDNGLALAKTDAGYGYINKNGDFVVSPRFLSAYDFIDGVALVKTNEGYGYIDESGKFIFDGFFEKAWLCQNGLAPVMIDGLWGYIDMNGEIVIEPQFDGAGSFVGKIACVNVGELAGIIDKNGDFIIEPILNYTYRYNCRGMGYYEIAYSEDPSKPYAHDKLGYVREDGFIMEPFSECSIHFRTDGYARVCVDGKYGVIDFDGNYIIEPKYEYIYSATYLT